MATEKKALVTGAQNDHKAVRWLQERGFKVTFLERSELAPFQGAGFDIVAIGRFVRWHDLFLRDDAAVQAASRCCKEKGRILLFSAAYEEDQVFLYGRTPKGVDEAGQTVLRWDLKGAVHGVVGSLLTARNGQEVHISKL